jgi:hypothetical protein
MQIVQHLVHSEMLTQSELLQADVWQHTKGNAAWSEIETRMERMRTLHDIDEDLRSKMGDEPFNLDPIDEIEIDYAEIDEGMVFNSR